MNLEHITEMPEYVEQGRISILKMAFIVQYCLFYTKHLYVASISSELEMILSEKSVYYFKLEISGSKGGNSQAYIQSTKHHISEYDS